MSLDGPSAHPRQSISTSPRTVISESSVYEERKQVFCACKSLVSFKSFDKVLKVMKGSLKKSFDLYGTGRSMVLGLISKWWAAQHGRQLGYAATASGALGILFLTCFSQILFLQDSSTWGDYTGAAIGVGAFSAILLLLVLPEFFTLRGHALLLEELMELESTSEIRRRKADGNESASALGAGHEASWTAFLESKGLRR